MYYFTYIPSTYTYTRVVYMDTTGNFVPMFVVIIISFINYIIIVTMILLYKYIRNTLKKIAARQTKTT